MTTLTRTLSLTSGPPVRCNKRRCDHVGEPAALVRGGICMQVRAHGRPPLSSQTLLIADAGKVLGYTPIQLAAHRAVVPSCPFAAQYLDAGDGIADRRPPMKDACGVHAVGMADGRGIQRVAAVSEPEQKIEVVAIGERLVESAERHCEIL